MSKATYYIDVKVDAVISLSIDAKNKEEALKIAADAIKPPLELELSYPLSNVHYADVAVNSAKIDDVDFSG